MAGYTKYFYTALTVCFLWAVSKGPFLSGQEKQAGWSTLQADTVFINRQLLQAAALENKDFATAGRLYEEIASLCRQTGYKTGLIRAYNGMGNTRIKEGRYDEALQAFRTALPFCEVPVHGNYLAVLYNNMGNVFNYQLRYDLASRSYYTAAQYAVKYPGKFPAGYAYSNQATVLGQLKQLDKAITATDKAMPYAVAAHDFAFQANLFMNKGSLLYEQKAYTKAIGCFDSALYIADRHAIFKIKHMALINTASVYLAWHNPLKALKTLQEARQLEATHAVGFNESNAVLSAIGDAYLQLKNYTAARKYLTMANDNAGPASPKKLFLLNKISELEAATGHYNRAYQLQKKYHLLLDSLQGREITLKVSDMETRYRTAEKDKDIAMKQLHIAGQEKQLERKNFWMSIIFIASLLLIVAFSAWYVYQRQRNKLLLHNKEIENLKARIEGEEQERQRLARELHDGIGSQLAGAGSYLVAMGSIFPEVHNTGHYAKAKQILTETSVELRKVAHNLLPDIVGNKGLAEALMDFCQNSPPESTTTIEFHAYGKFELLTPFLSLSIYRIVQELVHNVRKHAAASEAIILLNEHAAEISIIVEDNGIGMEESVPFSGIGLGNIKKRVEACCGSMQIEPGAGKGTIVSVFLPKETSYYNSVPGQRLS